MMIVHGHKIISYGIGRSWFWETPICFKKTSTVQNVLARWYLLVRNISWPWAPWGLNLVASSAKWVGCRLYILSSNRITMVYAGSLWSLHKFLFFYFGITFLSHSSATDSQLTKAKRGLRQVRQVDMCPHVDTQWGSISRTRYWLSKHQTSTWCSLETCSIRKDGPYP